jgi:hypothetical protein
VRVATLPVDSPFKEVWRSSRRAWNVGTIPKATPTTADTSSVAPSTRALTPTLASRGMLAGARDKRTWVPQTASTTPTAAPSTESTNPSTKN